MFNSNGEKCSNEENEKGQIFKGKLPKRKIPYKQLSDPTAVIEEIR